jgi:hypothetical protein
LPRASQQDNYGEWFDAVEGRLEQAESNFSLAGPMTATILLGVIAQREPDTKLVWNADRMEIEGQPDLNKYIRREYREGWKLTI